MKNSALIKARKHGIALGGLNIHIWRRIWDYSPEKDSEIRRLLEVLNRQHPEGIQKQGFIERLGAFWDRKITFHLDSIWSEIRCKQLSNDKRKMYLEKVHEVQRLMDFAVAEMKSIESCKNAANFMCDLDHRLYLKTLISFLKDPFDEGEARIISNTLADGEWGYETLKIGIEDQVDPTHIVIKPLHELSDDDDMGHMMRHDGIIDIYPAGRIVIDGWNFPIMETEEGEFFAPIEDMLVEFGGCPLGLVFDSKILRGGEGYNPVEKSCKHCWKKDYCPGSDVMRAWTLGSLAKKLHFAWEHRNDVLKVVPGFEKKLLEMKK
ncbi:MAG: hypothetical protein ACD_56C00113G0002 [uncultured bacterium]|nr:MAG: hypothetical protein ACD_56C00113G0002 [uncultured bacterium]